MIFYHDFLEAFSHIVTNLFPTTNHTKVINSILCPVPCDRDGTGSWISVSLSDPMFDPVLSFNICVYHGVVSTQ